MTYPGKFRDFMVGWLALQLEELAVSSQEVEALYYSVVYAENDSMALAEVTQALGDWAARMLWVLSQRWYDTDVEMARGLIEAVRDYVQEYMGDSAEFYHFFLNPLTYSLVPADFREICWMLRVLYTTAGEAVLAPLGWKPYVAVEPSYEGESDIILLAYPEQDVDAKVFVLQDSYKAWHLRFASLQELAWELLALHQAIEKSATRAITRYRLTNMVIELPGQSAD